MSLEEQIECPLCMEPLELDDINFFPCTCGYQICRFCWHRIRTDENGLCPACRKQYPEDPAEFKPLTEEELQRIRKERRQKDLQRKQKAAENRKHLANVRVVQKNLVFVVGLSQRLGEPEVLRKHEYFGKFGKIHKVVINQNTSYAGAQGPSASAYVTYHKPEDALKAIQAVNNIHVDGRTLKASLGTTKYCSHFLRGAQCPKQDCMYLHELGDEQASFTKEQMQEGKHQEYEQQLYEQYMNTQNLTNHHVPPTSATTASNTKAKQQQQPRKKSSSPTIQRDQPSPPSQQPQPPQNTGGPSSSGHHPPHHTNKEAWPSLHTGNGRPDHRLTNGNKAPHTQQPPQTALSSGSQKRDSQNAQNRALAHQRNSSYPEEDSKSKESISAVPVGGVSHPNNNRHNTNNTAAITQQQQQQTQPQPPQTSSQQQISPPSLSSLVSGVQHMGAPPATQAVTRPGHIQQQISPTAAGGAQTNPHPHPQTHPQTNPPSNGVAPQQPPKQPSPTAIMNHINSTGAVPGVVSATKRLTFNGTSAADSMSLFSGGSGFPGNRNNKPVQQAPQPEENSHTTSTPEIPDTMPVSTTTDWQAAFGFTSAPIDFHDDELGFDPWDESSRALADLIEKEAVVNPALLPQPGAHVNHFLQGHFNPVAHGTAGPAPGLTQQQSQVPLHHHHHGGPQFTDATAAAQHSMPQNLPPGFTPNHIGAFPNNPLGLPGNKMVGLMHFPPVGPNYNPNSYHDVLSDIRAKQDPQNADDGDVYKIKDWQEGLKALLPNINISFGANQQNAEATSPGQQQQHQQQQLEQNRTQQQQLEQQKYNVQQQQKGWASGSPPDLSWDPAIVTSGQVSDNNVDEPHWMASLQSLTEDTTNHRLPFVQQFQMRTPGGLPPQNPPPGFLPNHIRPTTQLATEPHKLAEGLQ